MRGDFKEGVIKRPRFFRFACYGRPHISFFSCSAPQLPYRRPLQHLRVSISPNSIALHIITANTTYYANCLPDLYTVKGTSISANISADSPTREDHLLFSLARLVHHIHPSTIIIMLEHAWFLLKQMLLWSKRRAYLLVLSGAFSCTLPFVSLASIRVLVYMYATSLWCDGIIKGFSLL